MKDEQLKELGLLSLKRAKAGQAYGIINNQYKKVVDGMLDNQADSVKKRIDYYSKRVDDKSLTKKQRNYAKLRLKGLKKQL